MRSRTRLSRFLSTTALSLALGVIVNLAAYYLVSSDLPEVALVTLAVLAGFAVSLLLLTNIESVVKFALAILDSIRNRDLRIGWRSVRTVGKALITVVATLSLALVLIEKDAFTRLASAGELIGFVIAFLAVDNLYERHSRGEHIQQLIRQMASSDSELALRAVNELRSSGWAFDDSLESVNLEKVNLRAARLDGFRLIAADLQDAELDQVNLQAANLMRANLRGATLREASLVDANLREANLQGADLSNADLRRADLREANLQSSSLCKAALVDANLAGARLGDACLEGAELEGAVFSSSTEWPEGFGPAEFGAKLVPRRAKKGGFSMVEKEILIYNKQPGVFGRAFQRPDATVVVEGNEVQVYNRQPGFFGRTFQAPDKTVVVEDGQIDVYDKRAGFFGRMFQRPDETAVIKDNQIDVYRKESGILGRTFQKPDETVIMRGNEVDIYDKEAGIFGRTFQVPDRTIVIRSRTG